MNQKHLNYPNIAVTTRKGILFLQEREILYCHSQEGITYIYLTGIDQKIILVTKSLTRIVDLFNTDDFARIHQSYFINLNYLVKCTTTDKDCVVMCNGAELPLARGRKEAFLNRFKRL